jgi:hypothetical protein
MIECEKSLTVEQFKQVMQRIEKNHRFGKYGHTKGVKYVRPSFDMRDMKCFYIVRWLDSGE